MAQYYVTCQNIKSTGGIISVSYTHLDVYKRQISYFAGAKRIIGQDVYKRQGLTLADDDNDEISARNVQLLKNENMRF